MENTIPKQALMMLLIVFSAHVSASQARVLRGDHVRITSGIDSRVLLRELGFDLSKLRGHEGRVLVDSDRVSPGGPDPQHH
ncbi:PREDICTED: CLAVATA3/ESR (CLE)-related protein 5-like [Tarenaya hassleriana]|uniref:CLAVATA3/ESR (CLE)-related protein 5-like n=1 Tax=Tarenaya hassleriana TaxID=28532 RepID=UPI00053C2335|nr:PREDICTED: CLAVATA3/ESR (CLE)-related protein 5-like [Tarenaya hassleriana]XP_010557123.1 PREDICTED: CLAVATA3/ESR (CLE)-related protein 5-like [Tarenaya hassleriana]